MPTGQLLPQLVLLDVSKNASVLRHAGNFIYTLHTLSSSTPEIITSAGSWSRCYPNANSTSSRLFRVIKAYICVTNHYG